MEPCKNRARQVKRVIFEGNSARSNYGRCRKTAVIPSGVEGSRSVNLNVSRRDPSVRAGLACSLGMTAN